MRVKAQRQREGLDPLPMDRSLTVRSLLRWWLETYIAGRPSERQEEGRFRVYFEGSPWLRCRLRR